MDSSGTSDLAGIAAELDYLHGLGVDAIWLSPDTPLSEATLLTASRGRDKRRTPFSGAPAPVVVSVPPVCALAPREPHCDAGLNATARRIGPARLLLYPRLLLGVRRATPALQSGDYAPLQAGSSDVLAFLHEPAASGGRRVAAISMSLRPQGLQVQLPPIACPFSSANRAPGVAVALSNLPFAPLEVFTGQI